MKHPMLKGFHGLSIAPVVLAACVAGSAMGREAPAEVTSASRVESGNAEPTTEVLRVQRPGTVVALFVKAGDTVKKGQVLGHTELDQARLNLETAEANLHAEGTLNQMYWQHQAMIHSREDAEANARKRLISDSRLQQAVSMEKWAEGQYEAQRDLKKVHKIHYDHYKNEYESRIFRSPIDGVVKDVKVALAQNVGLAQHAFTITNDTYWSVPVNLSESSAEAAVAAGRVPLRNKAGGPTIWGRVASVTDQLTAEGMSKVVRLLVDKDDVRGRQPNLAAKNMKFDVIVPTAKGV